MIYSSRMTTIDSIDHNQSHVLPVVEDAVHSRRMMQGHDLEYWHLEEDESFMPPCHDPYSYYTLNTVHDYDDMDDNDEEVIEFQDRSSEDHSKLAGPSGCAGATLGLLIGGPLLAAITGFGLAYAVQKEGLTGDFARAMGEVPCLVRDKALELVDQEHHNVQQTRNTSEDRQNQYPLVQKAAEVLSASAKVVERGMEGTGQVFEYLIATVTGTTEDDTESTNAYPTHFTTTRNRVDSLDVKIMALEQELQINIHRPKPDLVQQYLLDPSKFGLDGTFY